MSHPQPTVLLTNREHFLTPFLMNAFNGTPISFFPSDAPDTSIMVHYGTNDATIVPETNNILADVAKLPRHVVFISSWEIYGHRSFENLTENSPAMGQWAEAENAISERATHDGASLSILRPGIIIGTGMDGYAREIVNGISRATYCHIEGNDARISAIHSLDVAQAAKNIVGKNGTFNISDGIDPTIEQLAEALAWRIGHKRIFSITPPKAHRMARVGDFIPFISPLDSRKLKMQTTTRTLSIENISQTINFHPINVIEYLTNHIYDESDI